MLKQGPTHLVSLIVVFSITQNVGGLAGSAVLGTAQVIYTRAHAASLGEHILSSDPQAVTRIQQGIGAISASSGEVVIALPIPSHLASWGDNEREGKLRADLETREDAARLEITSG